MDAIFSIIGRVIVYLWLAVFVAWIASEATAATPRGQAATYQFRKANPCPSTAMYTGACPGWRMDHMVSLRCGGADTPENLWWLTVAEHKAKLKPESQCWRYYQGNK